MNKQNQQILERSLIVARSAIEGRLDLHRACDELSAIGEQNNYPEYLIELIHLSHLQNGHEHIGFNEANLRDSIEAEIRELLQISNENTESVGADILGDPPVNSRNQLNY